MRRRLESLRSSLGLGNSFTLAGSVADVPRFLASVNVAVLPSHSEGMSNALLEAMAAGRAVVATDVGANARVLGDAGLIVPPRDDAALAAAILRLLDEPILAAKLGQAARQRVEANFSREAMRQRFEDFYLELLALKCRAARG
jgi:glycosyltransferase involved in cell wall biosynthesis